MKLNVKIPVPIACQGFVIQTVAMGSQTEPNYDESNCLILVNIPSQDDDEMAMRQAIQDQDRDKAWHIKGNRLRIIQPLNRIVGGLSVEIQLDECQTVHTGKRPGG